MNAAEVAARRAAFLARSEVRPKDPAAPDPVTEPATVTARLSPSEEVSAVAKRISDEIKARGYTYPPPPTAAVHAAERRIDALGAKLRDAPDDGVARLDLTDALEAWRAAYLEAAQPRRKP